MGLDMYLTKKSFIGAEYEHRKVTGTCNIKMDNKKVPIKFNRISEISERVAYWRKANQIHAWFVKNVQNGVDDCKEYSVSLEQLKELQTLCSQTMKILRSKNPQKALETLPPQAGFFFGSTEIDQWYKEDITYTQKVLKSLIKDLEAEEKLKLATYTEIIYRSSW